MELADGPNNPLIRIRFTCFSFDVDVQIDYGTEKKLLIGYEQIVTSARNITGKKTEGTHEMQWKRLDRQRLQVGYK